MMPGLLGKRQMARITLRAVALAILTVSSVRAEDVRIKDITDVEGQRINTITGLGLVTGLAGTGGTSPVTREVAANILPRLGVRFDPLVRAALRDDTRQRTDNLSVVLVSADLPTTARPGQHTDVVVSTYDDAESLQGGMLVMTPLLGVDGEVYATASGPVSVGGFSFSGDAATVQQNFPTSGRIPNGAVVEKPVPICHTELPCQHLLLREADLETAHRIAQSINQIAPNTALVVDAGTIRVATPLSLDERLAFLAMIGNLRVSPDTIARVIVNERTGTVVIGENVKLSQVAVTHANLSVITSETPEVAQPLPFARGRTTVVPRTEIDVMEEDRSIQVFPASATVGDLAQALNALGVTPRDLSSIFQLLKESGALHAKLEFK